MVAPHAHRNVTHRDGGREGDPDAEADRSAMKDAQRDLTSLSTPVGAKRKKGAL